MQRTLTLSNQPGRGEGSIEGICDFAFTEKLIQSLLGTSKYGKEVSKNIQVIRI